MSVQTAKAGWKLIALLAAVWLVLRILLLFSAGEIVLSFDEFELGTLARELLTGLKLPYWQYQVDVYSGESLFLAPFTCLLFKLLGPTLFALKLTPVLFSFASYAMALWFLNRHWGRRAMLAGGLVLMFPPPNFLNLTILAQSGHTEILVLGMLMVILFYEFLYGEGRRTFFLCAFALLSGFSTWVYYENFIITAACLTAGLFSGRKFLRAENALVFAGFFLAGFSPWIFYNVKTEFAGMTLFFQAADVKEHDSFSMLRKAVRFIVRRVPVSFNSTEFHPWIPARLYSMLYASFFLGVPAFFAIKKMLSPGFHLFKSKSAFFLIYPALFLLFYSVCPLSVQPEMGAYGFRYLSALFFFGCMSWGIVLGRPVRFARAMAAAVIILAFTAQAGLYFRPRPGGILSYKGYSYFYFAIPFHLSGAYGVIKYHDLVRVSDRFSPEDLKFLYWGLFNRAGSFGQTHIISPEGTPEEVLKHVPREALPFYYLWLGTISTVDADGFRAEADRVPEANRLHFAHTWFLNHSAEIRKPGFVDKLTPEERDMFYFTLGRDLYYRMLEEELKDSFMNVRPYLENELAPEGRNRAWMLRGLGSARTKYSYYFERDQNYNLIAKIIESLPANDRPDIYWGLGWNKRSVFREDEIRSLERIYILESSARVPAVEGSEAFERFVGIS